ncbi:beta-lactamase class C and other penicillin binding proteins [Longilinea arvoryzae]|uniref:Beta-lactamase class C and other penicillin binding proteins n=1 Tax=Longilinea arvoryzae TaxID=360412 RepID=A0A0S7B901_9CHLR|nr:serine hydrolase domain-containing protein [Longilinea arvoryzae]GAP13831.1 beta-lactamase class C and other penicillin binding proteins [Longilinea arvoryzae]
MTDETTFQELVDFIREAMPRWHVPGVAVGVHFQGCQWTAGLGVTSVDFPLPVNADTLFQIGSITKTVTATAAMRLVEKEQLSLDAPVRSLLPELDLADEDAAAQVTLRHLLTHTGGWAGDYFDDSGRGDDALARILPRLKRLEQLTPVGEVWAYNNAGFYIAGRMIELAAGKVYEEAARELVLDPLGMRACTYFPEDVMTRSFVVGHQLAGDQPRVAAPWAPARSCSPVGGLIATVGDLLAYARFHMGNGNGLLRPETLRQMQSRLVKADGARWVGLSWYITPYQTPAGEVEVIGHGGATNGQEALFRMVPQRDFAIAILTNSDGGDPLNTESLAFALDHFLGLRAKKAQPVEMPAGRVNEYLGSYDAQEATIVLYMQGKDLMARAVKKGGFPTPDSPPPPQPDPTRLVFLSPDHMRALDGLFTDKEMEVIRAKDGGIIWLRSSGRLFRRLPANA